ncbi:MAG: DUF2779 domain-containing protein [Candidatus Eisenbacteria bacterium]
MSRRPHQLSKSRFTQGLQCHRLLWWRTHEPDAPELAVGPAQQAIFDNGTRVGELARGQVPGGVLVDLPYDDFAGKLEATQAALAQRPPAIYEASVAADGVFVAVDILQRDGDAWRVVEVKSSTKVKPQHLPDAAVQVHALRAAGLRVSGAEIMVLNSACRYPDLSNLFRREDVTRDVELSLGDVAAEVRTQLAVLAGPLPEVATGPHCDAPYTCPFKSRCWAATPEHHVSTLYYVGANLNKFLAQGWTTILDLPDGSVKNAIADRQRRSVQAGRVLVEGDLAGALGQFPFPRAYFDFETVMPAIPVWNGCGPYAQVPAQFSCHVEQADGSLVHHEWVADEPGDPRPAIAAAVVEACRGAACVVAYNASFERRALEHLAEAVPALAGGLRDVIARMVDLLPVVRDHVYHPDFGGSFSIKAVLPALVPEFSYEGLDVASGDHASQVLTTMLLEPEAYTPLERAALRDALLAYCRLDTLAMVKVLHRLQELAGTHAG